MFTKLKKQVNEKSSVTDVNVDSLLLAAATTSSSKPSSATASGEVKNVGLHLSRSKSGSDGNQSGSDDNSSTKSSSNASKTLVVDALKSNDTSTNSYHEAISDNNNKCGGGTFDNLHVNKETDSIKSQLQQLNESLLKQIDLLTNELNEKLKENEDLRSKSIKLNNQLEDYEIEQERCRGELENVKLLLSDYENEIKILKNDKDELIVKNAELSEKYELLKLVNNKQIPLNNHSQPVTDHHQQQQHHEAASSSSSFHLDETKQLRDELNERNKVIKNLQQRINDMKKTLQKELKYQALPNESDKQHQNATQQQHQQSLALKSSNELNNRPKMPQNGIPLTDTSSPTTITTTATAKKNSVSFQSNSSTNMGRGKLSLSSSSSNSTEDVNSKYLKHVILKFLTSREYEAIHLVKAISVLLNFTSDEEKVLKESLEWKMSWFGSKPKLVT